MNNILITTECVADLPESIYKSGDVDVIYFDIMTEKGQFRDTVEVDSTNIIEYMAGGHQKVYSVVPSANEYKNFFMKNLKDYDAIIHICISSGVSVAYSNAMLARVKMGRDSKRIFIVDSRQISSGHGLVTMKAIEYRDKGMNCKEITSALNDFIPRVSSSFLTYNADHMYYNARVNKFVKKICDTFKIHPVFMVIDGKMVVKKFYIGTYNRAMTKYIDYIVGDPSTIDTQTGFITYVDCNEELLEQIRMSVGNKVDFDTVYEQQASATISTNSGPKTFGLLFVRN
ncbi:MAG: DegV family protein [Saccharofermentans sp.]|nr:DegV family protein [Saccharofermentans sp.]